MNLVESIMTNNPCYTAGRKIDVKGLMLHSVGCSQPNAQVFINSWNNENFDRACVHGFIDGNDGTVYQTLPWDHRGWHAGGDANNTHIGVEMCEPACITYTGGSSFTCSDEETAKAVATRTYNAAVELFAMLCDKFGLDPQADGVIVSHREGCARGIASNHGDPEHLWNQLGMGYSMDTFRLDVANAMGGVLPAQEVDTSMQASEFADMSEGDIIAKVGPLFTANQQASGVLASVSLAQFILESGYGKSELAQNANNCFGMKKSLSGNTWSGSTWDGESVYTKTTQEQNSDGSYETITADFRKYPNVADSIADHSAYLLGAMNGDNKRYAGLEGQTDYRTAIQIIKDGGYATSLTYVEKICNIIEKWNLTQYDVGNSKSSGSSSKSVDELAREVIQGKWGNGNDRKQALEAAGYNYSEVQTRVNELMGGSATTEAKKETKSVDELAKEVIQGKWGNGNDRKQALEAAGYNYSAVQTKVNELMGGGSSSTTETKTTSSKSVDELANEVIRGDWGNGAERKQRLTAAGYDYSAIQNRVNELLS